VAPRRGGELGFAQAIALPVDLDDIGVVHDAFDEGGGAPGTGEDRVPVGEGEIGGQDKAFLLVRPADDLEDEVRVAVVEREESEWDPLEAGAERPSACRCPSAVFEQLHDDAPGLFHRDHGVLVNGYRGGAKKCHGRLRVVAVITDLTTFRIQRAGFRRRSLPMASAARPERSRYPAQARW
jgi:hypothetical protein